MEWGQIGQDAGKMQTRCRQRASKGEKAEQDWRGLEAVERFFRRFFLEG
jgi:hypothetical protein